MAKTLVRGGETFHVSEYGGSVIGLSSSAPSGHVKEEDGTLAIGTEAGTAFNTMGASSTLVDIGIPAKGSVTVTTANTTWVCVEY